MNAYLLLIKDIDYRHIHGSNILTLSFRGCGIMKLKEVLDKLLVDPISINVFEMIHLNLLGIPSSHLQENITASVNASVRTSLYVGFAVAVGGPIKPTLPLTIRPGKADLKNFSVPQ